MVRINFYLVRHGQTQLNAAQRLQGIYNSPLTSQGVRTAQQLAKLLANVHFDAAYSSDLGRAQQTARIIVQPHPELPALKIDGGLREFNFGGLEGTPNWTIVWAAKRRFGWIKLIELLMSRERFATLVWLFTTLDPTRTAETLVGVTDRINKALRRIGLYESQGAKQDKNVLIVAHGLVLSAFVYQLFPDALPLQLLKNSSVTKVVFENGRFTLVAINQTGKAGKRQQKRLF